MQANLKSNIPSHGTISRISPVHLHTLILMVLWLMTGNNICIFLANAIDFHRLSTQVYQIPSSSRFCDTSPNTIFCLSCFSAELSFALLKSKGFQFGVNRKEQYIVLFGLDVRCIYSCIIFYSLGTFNPVVFNASIDIVSFSSGIQDQLNWLPILDSPTMCDHCIISLIIQ